MAEKLSLPLKDYQSYSWNPARCQHSESEWTWEQCRPNK